MRLSRPLVFIAVLLIATNFGLAGETNRPIRPASWARPLTAPGLRNLYQVTTNLYRGAQPPGKA